MVTRIRLSSASAKPTKSGAPSWLASERGATKPKAEPPKAHPAYCVMHSRSAANSDRTCVYSSLFSVSTSSYLPKKFRMIGFRSSSVSDRNPFAFVTSSIASLTHLATALWNMSAVSIL